MRRVLILFFLFMSGCVSIYSQVPIDTAQSVMVGGIQQYITLKGTDRTKPLLLFLHGGPGNSVMGYSDKFTNKLVEHFVVVQWDQRESGKTLALNKSPRGLSVDQFEDDTHEMIEWLLKKFNHPKVYLVGHSWGTYLGFYIAKNYSELLYAYIPICPMVNQLESERIILDLMKTKATAKHNKTELEELSFITIPFATGEQLYYHRKWLQDYGGQKFRATKEYVENWSSTWLDVFNKASMDNLVESAKELKCPVYFFVGRNDFQTNSQLTEKYYEQLKAPKKQLFWFENAGHSLPSSHPTLMQDIIINKILPEFSPLSRQVVKP